MLKAMSSSHRTRRQFLKAAAFCAAMTLLDGAFSSALAAAGDFVAPHEAGPHSRTWMAWPSSARIWGSGLAGIQGDISLIAKTIARYEPVIMCADGSDAAAVAREMCGNSVAVVEDIPVNDCWIRDSGCLFRCNGDGGMDAIGLNFNGWGGKQASGKDAGVARQMAAKVPVRFSAADFVSEPGAIETDGEGTLIATESSIINPNRNPGKSREQLEAAMMSAYGATKVVWVPGVRGLDITDGHIDATSRFVRPGVVMIQVSPSSLDGPYAEDSRRQLQILSRATDAKGRPLKVIPIKAPVATRVGGRDFLDSYLNFYTVNGAVITAQFGDEARDAAARAALEQAFPGRKVEMLDLDRLYHGGGGVHCVTQHQPAD